MEPRRNLNILPSNAPAYHENITSLSITTPSRILQDTSGNVQSNILDSVQQHHQRKAILPSQPEISHPKYFSPTVHVRPTVASRLEEKRKQRNRAHGIDNLPRLTKQQRNTPEYQAYRARQRTQTDTEGEPVWPDDLEEAFHEALDEIKAIGRRKIAWRGKPCGRNELIAAYLHNKTGKHRTRKQVSSHIQVLKGFNKNNPEFMAKVTAKDPADAFEVKAFANDESMRRFVSGHRPLDAHPSYAPRNEETYPSYGAPSPAPRGTLGSNVPSQTYNSVQTLDFNMWVQPRHHQAVKEMAFHTYTTVQSDTRLPQAPLENVRNWRSTFPPLAALENENRIDSEVVLLETSFNLMTDFPPEGSQIGMQLEFTSNNGFAYDSWKCTTNIYTGGKRVMTSSNTVPHYVNEMDGTAKVSPKFESPFWAKLFTGLTEKRRSWEEAGDAEGLRREEEGTRRFVRGLSAVQELYAIPKTGGSRPQRIAILLWKFRQTRPEEMGTTTWRNLIPAPARILMNSPLPPETQLPMSLERSLEQAGAHANASYAEHYEQQPSFSYREASPNTFSRSPTMANFSASSIEGPSQENVNVDFHGAHINMSWEEPSSLHTYEGTSTYIPPPDNVPQYEGAQWGMGYNSLFADPGFQVPQSSVGSMVVEVGGEMKHDRRHALAYR
ncbi:MAG: hypothetical protein M1827_001318 [Pycnora praestabilis]|nr:MAG: hypothetical protein M1827_001318 [Pycnora praestabilis]